MSRRSNSNSVQKLCSILRVLSTPQPLRLIDVCESTELNKATALRLLGALTREGFVRRDPDTKRFSLGDEALALGIAMQGRDHVRDLARPWLVRLAGLSGDTIALAARSGLESVCLDVAWGSYPIRANYLSVGTRRPLGVGSGAMVMLAWMPDEEASAILDLTADSITTRWPRLTRRFLEDEILASRERGHSLIINVMVERMGGIGVPVLGPDGRAVAALSLAALSDRILSRLDLLVPALREAAVALATPMTTRPAAASLAATAGGVHPRGTPSTASAPLESLIADMPEPGLAHDPFGQSRRALSQSGLEPPTRRPRGTRSATQAHARPATPDEKLTTDTSSDLGHDAASSGRDPH